MDGSIGLVMEMVLRLVLERFHLSDQVIVSPCDCGLLCLTKSSERKTLLCEQQA